MNIQLCYNSYCTSESQFTVYNLFCIVIQLRMFVTLTNYNKIKLRLYTVSISDVKNGVTKYTTNSS